MEFENVGLFSGSISYRRFTVVGELPDNYRNDYLDAVQARAHKEIEVSSDDERAVGWVVCGDLLDTNFTMEKLFIGDVLALTLRVDTLRIPSSALSLYLKQAEREFAAATEKEKLSKRDKEEVKDRVLKALRKRQLPSIKGFDLAWSVNDGVLRLWTHNKTVTDDFMGLFQDTFGLRLVPRTPYTAIGELEMEEAVADAALAIEPADFTVPASENAIEAANAAASSN